MSKTIRISLSQGSINKAIRDLEKYQERLERNTAKLVDELVDGGAEMAKFAFGSTAVVDRISEAGTGIIEAVGESINIMEFGAGMATMESHPLAANASVPVQRWSYSEWNLQHGGSGEGFLTQDHWHFGGRLYREVIPRHGMLDARDYVVNNLEAKARTVFK